MAKSKSRKTESANPSSTKTTKMFNAISDSYDPALASLFASSLGPVKAAKTSNPGRTSAPRLPSAPEIMDALQEAESSDRIEDAHENHTSAVYGVNSGSRLDGEQSRKRKRSDDGDDVEGRYMHRLVQEEARENEIRRNGQTDKRQKKQPGAVDGNSTSSVGVSEPEMAQSRIGHGERSSDIETPQHESLATSKATKEDPELEKASRTVFLANVSTLAIKSKTARKTLLDHLASFLVSLPKEDTLHKVDSLRFRSTAFSSTGVPKKSAYAKKELMDSTTKSTNAYAVYSTQLAAREATKKLNGTVVLDRHLRVDSVAHPAKQDHHRCVFVGNLGFVDDMSTIDAAEDEENHKRPRKAKEPADIEEGLWRQFGKAGTLESVRVVRDKTTRVGKGFAYVQFRDANAVERALLYNEKKFPPMLPRILRVTRAKNISKTASSKDKGKRHVTVGRASKPTGTFTRKVSSEAQSLSGRAGKLLGRAGAARIHGTGDRKTARKGKVGEMAKSQEVMVFEGYRASSKQGKGTMKMGGSGKKQGKPRTRSSRRGAEFKRSGGKKGKS